MFCPKCRRENPDDYNFCPECGHSLHPVGPAPEDVVSALHQHYGVQSDHELETILRERLFTDGATRKRDDVERWLAIHLQRDQRPSLVGAQLSEMVLERINLVGIDLHMADMYRADLKGANLFLANLREVNLQETYLFLANLQEADLGRAKLNGANLKLANLIRANLHMCDLQDAQLTRTKLHGANLRGADLQGATLFADWNPDSILPDGSRWAPDTDLARFIDPAHPDFWRANDPQSPAYRAH